MRIVTMFCGISVATAIAASGAAGGGRLVVGPPSSTPVKSATGATLAVSAGGTDRRGARPAAGPLKNHQARRVLPFSGRIMGKQRSYVFDFLVTRAPPGYGSVRNTIRQFDVVSSTLIFLDGTPAKSSDLAVGQKVTVYLDVLPGGAFNAVAKRVLAYAVADTGDGTSSTTAALAGKTFVYVKVLPKDPGWHSPRPKEDTVAVKVFGDGKTVQIKWLVWTGTGCGGVDSSGRRYSYPVGDMMVTALTAGRTFHVVDTRPFMRGTRVHRSEVYGEFGADGSYLKLRLRQKLDVITPSGGRFRCDGRWLHLRLHSRRDGP